MDGCSNKNEVNDQRLETWIKLESICVKCFDFTMIRRAKLNNSAIKGNNQIRTQFIALFYAFSIFVFTFKRSHQSRIELFEVK